MRRLSAVRFGVLEQRVDQRRVAEQAGLVDDERLLGAPVDGARGPQSVRSETFRWRTICSRTMASSVCDAIASISAALIASPRRELREHVRRETPRSVAPAAADDLRIRSPQDPEEGADPVVGLEREDAPRRELAGPRCGGRTRPEKRNEVVDVRLVR